MNRLCLSISRMKEMTTATILMFLMLLFPTMSAGAEDCVALRKSLDRSSRNALQKETNAQCRTFREIIETITATLECKEALDRVKVEIESRISVRCKCPEKPRHVLEECLALFDAGDHCSSEQETALKKCITQIIDMKGCTGVDKSELQKARQRLDMAYGRCPVCQKKNGRIANTVQMAKKASRCQELVEPTRTYRALRICPGVTQSDLALLGESIDAAKERVSCVSEPVELYRVIDDLNEKIAKFENCAADARCRELEVQRFYALTAYLEYARSRSKREEQRVVQLLRGVGVSPSLLEIWSRHDSHELNLISTIHEIFQNPNRRKTFVQGLKESDLRDLGAMLEKNSGTFASFIEAFRTVDIETQRRALGLADRLNHSVQTFLDTQFAHESPGRWEIWLDKKNDDCKDCGGFNSEFLSFFRGASVEWTPSVQSFKTRLRKRHERCQNRRLGDIDEDEDPHALGCGLLLKVDVNRRNISGQLYFIDGKGDIDKLSPVHVEGVSIDETSTSTSIAEEFAKNVLLLVSARYTLPSAGGLPPVEPSHNCGVSVSYFPRFKPAPVGEDLQVVGDCGMPELVKGLRLELAESWHIGEVSAVNEERETPNATLILNSLETPEHVRACLGEIHLRNRDDESIYAAKVVIDMAEQCDGETGDIDAKKRMTLAGDDMGRLIAAYYATPRNVSVETDSSVILNEKGLATAPVKKKPTTSPPVESSGWYSLAFAGVPYLQDDRATTFSRVAMSTLDAGLMIGAGASLGVAVSLRNKYATNDIPSVKPAELALNVGVGLTIGWAVTRIVSALVYEYSDVWQRGEKKSNAKMISRNRR